MFPLNMKMFPNIADEFITTKLFTYDDINLYNFSLLFCLFIIKLFFFFSCGAAAQREPWPPYSRDF